MAKRTKPVSSGKTGKNVQPQTPTKVAAKNQSIADKKVTATTKSSAQSSKRSSGKDRSANSIKQATRALKGKAGTSKASSKTDGAAGKTKQISRKQTVAKTVGKKARSEKQGAGSNSASRQKKAAATTEKLRAVTPSGKNDQTFFELVFEVARQIPKGRVTSYGAIAASLGARSSSRLVGWAMNLAGGAKPKVPAHRVVNRNGMLSGKHHFATPTLMQELLEKEGVKVKNDTVTDFNKLFWDPMEMGE